MECLCHITNAEAMKMFSTFACVLCICGCPTWTHIQIVTVKGFCDLTKHVFGHNSRTHRRSFEGNVHKCLIMIKSWKRSKRSKLYCDILLFSNITFLAIIQPHNSNRRGNCEYLPFSQILNWQSWVPTLELENLYRWSAKNLVEDVCFWNM